MNWCLRGSRQAGAMDENKEAEAAVARQSGGCYRKEADD